MTAPQKFRVACYIIEGLNSFAAVIYFNYLYFFFRDKFGFNDKENLALAAFIGLIYTVASWQAGKFAHRSGQFNALKIGFGLMAAGLAVGSQLHTVAGAIAAACVVNVGVCFIWPTLEALVSEGEAPDHIPHAVGIYNITWAITNASAFFIGGTLIEKLGYQSIFYVPLAFMIVQFAMVFWLEKIQPKRSRTDILPVQFQDEDCSAPSIQPSWPDAGSTTRIRAKNFQRMAWLANPFAYIAINTLLAVLPGVAAKFHLSPMLAGFACSLWCFARFFAFIVLWRWTGWHYRFRWLVVAFVLLIASFAAILAIPNLGAVLFAQLFFGAAIGLIYYSSLFYSMDASETKSEHGGIHEAVIGVGNCVGPGIGAVSLQFFPQYTNNGVLAVSALLVCGLGGLLWLRSSAGPVRTSAGL
jgi:predicted MFS family arabinose efflux permease